MQWHCVHVRVAPVRSAPAGSPWQSTESLHSAVYVCQSSRSCLPLQQAGVPPQRQQAAAPSRTSRSSRPCTCCPRSRPCNCEEEQGVCRGHFTHLVIRGVHKLARLLSSFTSHGVTSTLDVRDGELLVVWELVNCNVSDELLRARWHFCRRCRCRGRGPPPSTCHRSSERGNSPPTQRDVDPARCAAGALNKLTMLSICTLAQLGTALAYTCTFSGAASRLAFFPLRGARMRGCVHHVTRATRGQRGRLWDYTRSCT